MLKDPLFRRIPAQLGAVQPQGDVGQMRDGCCGFYAAADGIDKVPEVVLALRSMPVWCGLSGRLLRFFAQGGSCQFSFFAPTAKWYYKKFIY